MAPPAAGDDRPGDPSDLTRLADPVPGPDPAEALRRFLTDLGLTPRAALAGAAIVLVVAVGAWWWWHEPAPSGAEASLPLAGPVAAASSVPTAPTVTEVVAHAAGAVTDPGVYTLAAGARVADLVDAAGGARPRADLDRINLAAPLGDGAQIYVPRLGEATPPTAEAPAGPAAPSLVDLNTAGSEELETLPGIGPATAAAIIQHRQDNGPFTSVDDLVTVSGIGDAKMAAVRDLVTV